MLVDLRRHAGDRRAQHRVVEIALGLIEHGRRPACNGGYCSIGSSELPRSWLRKPSSCCWSCSSCVFAVTTAASALSRSTCEPLRLATSVVLRSTSRCLRSAVSRASAMRRVVEARLVFRLAKSVRTEASRASACVDAPLERLRIDLEQRIAGVDALAFRDRHAADLAGDVRRDEHLLRADIGVVGRDVAARREIEISRRRRARSAEVTTSRIQRSRLREERAAGFGSDGRHQIRAPALPGSCAVRRLCRPWRDPSGRRRGLHPRLCLQPCPRSSWRSRRAGCPACARTRRSCARSS